MQNEHESSQTQRGRKRHGLKEGLIEEREGDERCTQGRGWRDGVRMRAK